MDTDDLFVRFSIGPWPGLTVGEVVGWLVLGLELVLGTVLGLELDQSDTKGSFVGLSI